MWGVHCSSHPSGCGKCATDIEMLMASVQLSHHFSKWIRPCVCGTVSENVLPWTSGFHEYVTTSEPVFVTKGHYGSKTSSMRLLYPDSQRTRQAALYKTVWYKDESNWSGVNPHTRFMCKVSVRSKQVAGRDSTVALWVVKQPWQLVTTVWRQSQMSRNQNIIESWANEEHASSNHLPIP